MAIPLEDIWLIQQLKHKYFRCIDTANVKELETLFTDDVQIDYVGGDYHIVQHGKKAMIEYLQGAFHNQAVGMHQGHCPEIEVTSPTTAHGTWYLHDIFLNLQAKEYTEGSALYYDKYVKVDGKWLIKESRYERIIEIFKKYENLEKEIGTVTAHYLATRAKPPGPNSNK
jgi:hypothetical protein